MHSRRRPAVGANIDCGADSKCQRSVTGAERAAWCSERVVARAAAVGNAVAARQVIVIGAAVLLCRRPSLSARTRTLLLVCVMLAHRSFFSRSRRRLTPRRRCRRSRFLRCGGWRPSQGRPDEVGAIGGGGRCTPFFFKASLSFLVFFMLVLVRSDLFNFILYVRIYCVIINSDDAHDERVLPKRRLNYSFVFH